MATALRKLAYRRVTRNEAYNPALKRRAAEERRIPMQLVEIRDLDGPNVFLLKPAIKIELAITEDDFRPEAILRFRLSRDAFGAGEDEVDEDGETVLGLPNRPGIEGEATQPSVAPNQLASIADGLIEVIRTLHRRTGQPAPDTHWEEMETPSHLAIAFTWQHRRFAVEVAQVVAGIAADTRVSLDGWVAELQRIVDSPHQEDDEPLMVRDADRHVPVIGITGTNGKTTTTRLIAHILRSSGKSVGWSSSTGVYINGDEVIEGDYTGPQGALRVLEEPGLDVAVLETARGGILLRGVAYESNDVSVFINVSADHLDLQGVRSVEGLARVKATVPSVTRASGRAVLNAEDPLVRGAASGIKAGILFFSQDSELPAVVTHVESGGDALVVRDGDIVFSRHGQHVSVVSVDAIPMTFGGRAPHMIENALAGAAACLALGMPVDEVRSGLTSFHNAPDQNAGRLNVYDVDGVIVIADYAHNEAGLTQLLAFAVKFTGEGGKLFTVIGTAGDRTDETLRSLGRIAAEQSERVIVKRTTRYLRGREPGDMETHFRAGLAEGGREMEDPADTEISALDRLLPDAKTGDVIAMMCIEQVKEVPEHLLSIGRAISFS